MFHFIRKLGPTTYLKKGKSVTFKKNKK